MKALKWKTIRSFLAGFLTLILIAFHFSSAAEEPKRIALLPFKINAEKDFSYLRDGIYDMLTSRLSLEGKVEVLERKKTEEAIESVAGSNPVNESKAREIGARLNADFVLFGSLTVFGNSVSIDAKMVEVAGSRPTMSFFEQGQDLGAVITKINLIAEDINAKLFGRATVAERAPAQPQTSQTQAAQPSQPDLHAHPEKLLESGISDERGAGEASDLMISEAREAREVYQQFWRSASFKHLINGLALGDVDGDQKMETVVVTPHSILIYRSDQGKFFKTAEISESSQHYFIGVDVADINANGYAEIFVTGLNSLKNQAVSMVLEYDGKNYNEIVKNSSWFYRVADSSTKGQVLLGQQHRSGNPFSGAIFEMTWQNSDYAPGNEIKTPKDISLMGLTLGDVLNDHQDNAVAYRQNDRLQIFEPTGNEVWAGSERYGGSMLYYAGPRKDLGDVENRLYFPMRIRVWKDKDGKSEVIAVINHELTGMKLAFRKFAKAHIESLSWDGLGLAPIWKTRQISGQISDFAIGDFDHDGKIELVAAVIIEEGSTAFSTPKSTIIAYELKS